MINEQTLRVVISPSLDFRIGAIYARALSNIFGFDQIRGRAVNRISQERLEEAITDKWDI